MSRRASPARGNRRLEALLAAANADDRLKAWWHMQQVVADRLGMSDHSWVHVQVVLNVAPCLQDLAHMPMRGTAVSASAVGQIQSICPDRSKARIDAQYEKRLVPVFRI